jgi:hypothetical protein
MPEEYLHILELMKEQNLRDWEACTQTLGFRYEDLGRAMVQHWKLPEKLSGGMAQVEHFTSRTSNEADMLYLITAVSRSLSFAVYRDGPEEGAKKIDFLLNRFGSALHLNGESLNSVLRDALTETKELFAVARVPLEDLRLDRHIENAMASILPVAVERAQPVVSAVINELTIQETQFSDLSREVELVLDSAEDYPLNDLIMMILEAIFRGVQCDRVLFCLLEQDRSHVRGRMGIGEGAEELLADFRFPVSLLSGPVGSAVVGKKDVIVDDVELSRYHQSQFVATVGARAFAVCPLIIDNIAIGCFYLDMVETPLKVSDRTREILFRLRDRAAQIIEQKRRQA